MSNPLKGGPKGLEREPPAVGAKMYKATQSIRKHCKSIKLHKKHKTQDQGYIAITQTRIRKPKKTSGNHGKQWNSMKNQKKNFPWHHQISENCQAATKLVPRCRNYKAPTTKKTCWVPKQYPELYWVLISPLVFLGLACPTPSKSTKREPPAGGAKMYN